MVCVLAIYLSCYITRAQSRAVVLLLQNTHILSQNGESVIIGRPYLLHPNTAEENRERKKNKIKGRQEKDTF